MCQTIYSHIFCEFTILGRNSWDHHILKYRAGWATYDYTEHPTSDTRGVLGGNCRPVDCMRANTPSQPHTHTHTLKVPWCGLNIVFGALCVCVRHLKLGFCSLIIKVSKKKICLVVYYAVFADVEWRMFLGYVETVYLVALSIFGVCLNTT